MAETHSASSSVLLSPEQVNIQSRPQSSSETTSPGCQFGIAHELCRVVRLAVLEPKQELETHALIVARLPVLTKMRPAGIEPATSRSGGARSIP
jgi:hypothetical protein